MKIPRFGIFRKTPKVSSQHGHHHHNDRPNRRRSSASGRTAATTKRKRSITYAASNKSRLYPAELFPTSPTGVASQRPHYNNHIGGGGGGQRRHTPTALVPFRANHIDGERRDIVWYPMHQPQQRRPSTVFSPPPQPLPMIHDEEIIDWPPFPSTTTMAPARHRPQPAIIPMQSQSRECVGVPVVAPAINANAIMMNMNARTQQHHLTSQFQRQPTGFSTVLAGAVPPVPYPVPPPISAMSSFATNYTHLNLNNQTNAITNRGCAEWTVLNQQSSGAGSVVPGIIMPAMVNAVGVIGSDAVHRHGVMPMGTRLYRRKKVYFFFLNINLTFEISCLLVGFKSIGGAANTHLSLACVTWMSHSML